MFFESVAEIPQIAEKIGFSIFEIEKSLIDNFDLKNARFLSPNEKGKITVDMVKDFLSATNTKQTSPVFFVVKKAEAMDVEPANIMLKTIEEPKENYHFIFLSENLSALLPTVLSRAEVYVLRQKTDFSAPVVASEEAKALAKRLIAATDSTLPALSRDIAKKKDRLFALSVVSAAIEMSYKSFFLTKNPKFLQKLPNLLTLHDNLERNGNLKLHLIADML